MKYLIKDLSRMTGVKGFTIRKWQERYKIFKPQLAPNGYWYYSNEDYEVLVRIVRFLEEGEKISHIVALGRENLLKFKNEDGYSEEEKQFIRWLENDQFSEIENYLNEQEKQKNFSSFIRQSLEKQVALVGRAWQDGMISVADEHSFSRWVTTYIRNKCKKYETELKDKKPIWLVAVLPGDTHEIGALMHYAILLGKKVPARFVGTLPLDHIIRELNKGQYRTISISMTMAPQLTKLEKIKNTILNKTSVKKVIFGGRGYRLAKYGICKEK